MNDQYGQRSKDLRAVFASCQGEALGMQALYERMGAAEVGNAKERKNIRDTLPWLVRCGFLLKVGRGKEATFQASGVPLKVRRKLTEAELKERKRARNARRLPLQRVIRSIAVRDQEPSASKSSPPRWPAPVETVEQFLARGGRVQRLTAHWEQMERAA